MTTPTNLQSAALRAALDDRRRAEASDYPGTPTDVLTRPVLVGLAEYLITEIPATVNDAQRARLAALERLCRDAATYGYPRPPLEALGAQAGHLPAARTTDPATARDAGETARLVPSTRNQLGRLLVAFRTAELVSPAGGDLTSEEAAHRAAISPNAEYAKRCSDLMQLGYIRVAQDDDGHDRTRKGRAGLQRLVFELTPDGRRLADELIRKG